VLECAESAAIGEGVERIAGDNADADQARKGRLDPREKIGRRIE